MKLAVASLIRNEIDIIGGFLQHLDALFDYALLMDHGSIDGTDRAIAAACARRTGWAMWHVEPVGYHQTAFNGFALRHLFQHTDADVVMFLDVDEFINVPDRASLLAAFARLTDADCIGELGWRNAVPGRTDTRAISPGEPIWLPFAAGRFGKVVIPRHFYTRHGTEAHLGIGNHFLYYPPAIRVRAERVGEILHLPIRSHTQLQSKVLAGVFSVMAQVQRLPAQCWHWFDILDRIGEGTFRDDDLVGIAIALRRAWQSELNPRVMVRTAGQRLHPHSTECGIRASAAADRRTAGHGSGAPDRKRRAAISDGGPEQRRSGP